MNPEQEFWPQQAPLIPEAPRTFDIGDVLNNPWAVQKKPALYNPPWTENYTKQELDVARQIKEQWGWREDFLKEIEAIRNEEYPTEAKEDAGLPDLATKEEINKEASTLRNLWAGAATGLIETVWLAWSALEFWERVDSSPLNVLYKNLPSELQSQLKQYLPENITRENIFEGTLKPLEELSGLKDQAQVALGANPDATATIVGEFLTPDTWLWVWAVSIWIKNLIKKSPTLWRKLISSLTESVSKISGKEWLELLKKNPEESLRLLKWEGKLDDILVEIEQKVWSNTTEVALFNNLKETILKDLGKSWDDVLLTVERAGSDASLKLREIADIGKQNIADASINLKLTGSWYKEFVWKFSKVTGEDISESFTEAIIRDFPELSWPAKSALSVIDKEITAVAGKNPWVLKYEQLQQIRKNIDDNINWGDATAGVKNKWLKTFRDKFDKDIITKEFPEVKTLDAKFSKEIGEIEEMKKTLWKGWEESDGFRKSIIGLYKPWNELKLNRTANLLWIEPSRLKKLSKEISENVIKSSKAGDFAADSASVKLLNPIEDTSKLLKVANKNTGGKLDIVKNLLSKQNLENKTVAKLQQAKVADSDISKTLWIKTDENFTRVLFEMMDNKWTSKQVIENNVLMAKIRKEVWEESWKELQMTKAISEVIATKNTASPASIFANLILMNKVAPWSGALVVKYSKNPDGALKFVLEMAKSNNEAEVIAKTIQNWDKLTEKMLRTFSSIIEKTPNKTIWGGQTIEEFLTD